jgi:nucleotide-binding universal stress UspA family protein
MFNRILVPLDGSTLAERALPHAEQFARIFGSSIVLLLVLDPTTYHENPNSVDPLSWQIRKTEADMYMSRVATRLRESLRDSLPLFREGDEKKVRVEYSILEGKTAENIVNFAHTENIDLLIMSTHGTGGLSRWNISSVTQKVLNLIYLPVLIVRAFSPVDTEETRVRYHRILLPIDGSRRAEYALSAGIALAHGEMSPVIEPEAAPFPAFQTRTNIYSHPTKLILAIVIKPPELPILEPHPVEIDQLTEQLMGVSRQAANNYLNAMRERLPVDCEICLVENNSVTSAIQELANQRDDIDLVVLSAHGYTGQSTWPYGSVAHNYIEYGTKSVLVIQDIHGSQIQPTAAEIAAKRFGGR